MFPSFADLKFFNIHAYLAGQVIYTKQFTLTPTVEVLRKIYSDKPEDRTHVRKLKGRYIEDPQNHVLEKEYGIDKTTVAEYRVAVHSLNSFMDLIASTILVNSNYKFHPHLRQSTFRFTKTINEGYHLDTYTDFHNGPKLRFFFNYAQTCREWKIGETYQKLTTCKYPVRNIITADYLNEPGMLYGETTQHSFPPLAMWVCESQLIPHECIYGEQLATYTYNLFSAGG